MPVLFGTDAATFGVDFVSPLTPFVQRSLRTFYWVARRGSRKPGKYEPFRSLGILRSSVPRRVSKARWRYQLRCVVRYSLRS